ncbi:cysteine--tRNA ligase, partial [Acidithiobacillus caldus]|nr:cysteine--tRNA ligase [Acidithiobacillus caldus]
LFDLAREINRRRDAGEPFAALARRLRELGAVLGILQRRPEDFLRGDAAGIDVDWIEGRIAARAAARRERNFAEADRLRKELEECGILLEDGPGGTTWRQ